MAYFIKHKMGVGTWSTLVLNAVADSYAAEVAAKMTSEIVQ